MSKVRQYDLQRGIKTPLSQQVLDDHNKAMQDYEEKVYQALMAQTRSPMKQGFKPKAEPPRVGESTGMARRLRKPPEGRTALGKLYERADGVMIPVPQAVSDATDAAIQTYEDMLVAELIKSGKGKQVKRAAKGAVDVLRGEKAKSAQQRKGNPHRVPKGSPKGGQFASADGGGSDQTDLLY